MLDEVSLVPSLVIPGSSYPVVAWHANAFTRACSRASSTNTMIKTERAFFLHL